MRHPASPLMRRPGRRAPLLLFVAVAVMGCAAEPQTRTSEPRSAAAPSESGSYVMTEDGVAGLPGAQGRTFKTLDDYLAHRKKLGAMDVPFYELVRPGVYRLNTGRGMNRTEPQLYTREELARMFGFPE